jgi:hypothetical protein
LYHSPQAAPQGDSTQPTIKKSISAKLTPFNNHQHSTIAQALKIQDHLFNALSQSIQQEPNARINAAAHSEPSIQVDE